MESPIRGDLRRGSPFARIDVIRYAISIYLLLVPLGSSAQNLVSNGDFDTDVSGWANAFGTVWSTEDRDGDPQSGSAEIPITSAPQVYSQMWSCFPAQEAVAYSYGASFFLPTGGTPGVQADVFVQWYGNPTCDFSGGTVGSSQTLASEADGIWVDLQGTDVSPAGTQSGLMRVGYATPATGTSGSEVIRYDQVFVPEPSSPLLLLSGVLLLWRLGALRGTSARRSCSTVRSLSRFNAVRSRSKRCRIPSATNLRSSE